MIRRPPRSTLFPTRRSSDLTARGRSAKRNLQRPRAAAAEIVERAGAGPVALRSEEHTSELQSRLHLVCRLLLEKKKPSAPRSSSSSTHWRTAHTSHATRPLA